MTSKINIFRMFLTLTSRGGLPQEEITFAELAKERGYSTALIGKWHQGLNCETMHDSCHHPLKQGFDYFYGTPLTNLKDFGDEGLTIVNSRFPYYNYVVMVTFLVSMVTLRFACTRNIIGPLAYYSLSLLILSVFIVFIYIPSNLKFVNGVLMRDFDVVEQPINLYDNLTKRLVNESVTFIRSRQQDKNPFLLFIPWLQVHTALHCGKEFKGHSKHGKYGDEVEEMDWATGEIIKALEQYQMTNNTFVLFTSDQGPHVEERLPSGERVGGSTGIYRGAKFQGAMEGGIRVPTIVKWPGVIPAGSIVEQPTSLMDIFPTVASIIGQDVPRDREIDGQNIMPLLTGESTAPPHEFLFHYCGPYIHGARYAPKNDAAVWKVLYTTPEYLPGKEECAFICNCHGDVIHHNPPLLYNIAQDPSETRPLDPNEPENIAIIDKINKAKDSHVNGVKEVPSQFSVANLVPRPWLQPLCSDDFIPKRCKDPVYNHEGK